MHTFHRALLLVLFVTVEVYCQGGGGGGSHGSSSSSSHHYYSSSSRGGSCGTICSVILISIFSVFGFGILIFCIVVCCRNAGKGRPKQTNAQFLSEGDIVQRNPQDSMKRLHFPSGYWNSRYYQYNSWHGPHIFVLSFDPQTLKVTGSGADDVGKFTIDGSYSVNTGRCALTKSYQWATGNQWENLGHQVTIQLTWNVGQDKFVGKWYVRTNKFSGENEFELEFDKTYGKAVNGFPGAVMY